MTVRRFIAHSLSLSLFRHLDMTLCWNGRGKQTVILNLILLETIKTWHFFYCDIFFLSLNFVIYAFVLQITWRNGKQCRPWSDSLSGAVCLCLHRLHVILSKTLCTKFKANCTTFKEFSFREYDLHWDGRKICVCGGVLFSHLSVCLSLMLPCEGVGGRVSNKPCLFYFFFFFLSLILLLTTTPTFANSVDPDQMASSEAIWSGSTLFVIQFVNLKENIIWCNLIGW